MTDFTDEPEASQPPFGENGPTPAGRPRHGGTVRDQGPRTRRVVPGRTESAHRPPPNPSSRVSGWQVIAIIALIVATAGWTTAILLATRESSPPVAAASPTDSFEPEPSDDETIPPVADTHDAPELEARLPRELQGTALQVQSWDGAGILSDDAWSNAVTSFLSCAGRSPDDLRVAQAYDPDQALDGSIGVYHVKDLAPTEIRDALIDAWKGDYPDMVVSTIKVGGEELTKADFGEDTIDSYLLVRDDVVFDIETTDQALVAAAVAALPAASAAPSAPPRSAKPSGGSHLPAVCPSASPAGSPPAAASASPG